MLVVAKDLQTQYEKALDSASISRELRPYFRKWLREETTGGPNTPMNGVVGPFGCWCGSRLASTMRP
jgi:hypothetical protein